MGKPVRPGRWSVEIPPEGAVVFLIGMRINRLRAVRKWMSVTAAMPRMLQELAKQPELGLLSARSYLSRRDLLVVQYWRSVEHLNDYARASEKLHLPAWRAFNRAIGNTGVVGIYHETYHVKPGQFEAVYANMPDHGFALGLGGPVPVAQLAQSAASRMNRAVPDQPVEPPY